jgi:regulatory factor X
MIRLTLIFPVRLLDLYHVTQALNTVLTNTKRLGEMRKSWQNIDFDTIRNQSALVCNCRHEDLQLLEVEFAATLDSLPKSTEPVKEVIAWADKGFERLCVGKSAGKSPSLRSVLIRWSYVMDQIIRDLVRLNMLQPRCSSDRQCP